MPDAAKLIASRPMASNAWEKEAFSLHLRQAVAAIGETIPAQDKSGWG